MPFQNRHFLFVFYFIFLWQIDIWALGITAIAQAEMYPPKHELHPMKVMMEIPRAASPTLKDTKRWYVFFVFFFFLLGVFWRECWLWLSGKQTNKLPLRPLPFGAQVLKF